MAIYKQDIVDVELNSGSVHRSFTGNIIGGGDEAANRFGVRTFRNGEPEDIGGTCTGYFIRSDGATVVINNGVVDGNTAYITLPDTCYAVEGNFSLAIKCTGGSVIGTLRIVDGTVARTTTGSPIDPGTVIPSIEELLAAIDEAVASIPADYSGLWASLAPAFSTSTAYTVGQYVTYDGNLYRFTTAHAAGTWNSSHAERVTLGGELARRAFIGRRNLTSSDDIDDITEPGTYGKSPEVSPDNWPFSSSHQGRLNVFTPYAATNKYTYVQTAYDAADNSAAFRTGRESAWNSWVILASKDDVSRIRTSTTIGNGTNIANSAAWEFGGIANGVETDYINRIRCDYIPVSEYDRITFTIGSGFLYGIAKYNSSKVWIGEQAFTSDTKTLTIPGTEVAYVRLYLRNEGNTTMSLTNLRQVKAVAYRTNHAEIGSNSDKIREIRNISEDVEVGSWSIGYVYADGGIDVAQQPNYVCTMGLQVFPFRIYIMPDAGYQFMVRIWNSEGTSITYSTEWMTNAYNIPENTPFSVNASKTTPEAVGGNLADYVAAMHFRSAATEKLTSPAANRKTKMAVIGDSISTYDGYIETGYNSAYYPTGDVTSVDQMWWKIVADELGVTNIKVSAISQSAFYDYGNQLYPPVYDTNRISRIGTGGAPDIVLINAGTNDGFTGQTASIAYTADIPTIEAMANSTVKGIALTIRRVQAAYPNAKIVMMIPKQVKIASMQSGYNLERVGKIADEIKAYAEMFGVWKVIDLRKCGINQSNVASFCGDGIIHPNAKGMREIARYVMEELRR